MVKTKMQKSRGAAAAREERQPEVKVSLYRSVQEVLWRRRTAKALGLRRENAAVVGKFKLSQRSAVDFGEAICYLIFLMGY